MSRSQLESISPVLSETAHPSEKQALDAVTSISNQHRGWLGAVKSVLLAQAPSERAPLEYGGHRIAEEPTKKLGFGGVLAKFARFFGPGMIITVAYIDPDNFQTSFGDGQDFGYKMLFMVLFSLIVAIYLQASIFISLSMLSVIGCSPANTSIVPLLAHGYRHGPQPGPDEPQVYAPLAGAGRLRRR